MALVRMRIDQMGKDPPWLRVKGLGLRLLKFNI